MNCAVCHVEHFGDVHDGTSLEALFSCHHHQHGDHLQLLAFCEILLPGVSSGCLLVRGIPQFHHLLKLACQTFTFFPTHLLIITLEQMTLKHSMYMWKVPLYYTERACVILFWREVSQVLRTRGSTESPESYGVSVTIAVYILS